MENKNEDYEIIHRNHGTTKKKSRVIQPLDILLFDKRYYSYENYQKSILYYLMKSTKPVNSFDTQIFLPILYASISLLG